MLCLDYFPRGIARRAPELQHVTKHVVGELEHAGNEWVGGVLRSAAEHQTPQPQHVLAGLSSIHGPGAAGRAHISDELLTSDPVFIRVVRSTKTSDRVFGRPCHPHRIQRRLWVQTGGSSASVAPMLQANYLTTLSLRASLALSISSRVPTQSVAAACVLNQNRFHTKNFGVGATAKQTPLCLKSDVQIDLK